MENYPWFEQYPSFVRKEIDTAAYNSLMEIIDESLSKYGDAPAFTCMDKSLSFRQVDALSKDFAAYLQSIGMKKGDRIAIQMPNVLQYPIVLFGAIRAGLVVVNTNPLYTVREMTHQFNDAGADALVVLANFASKAQEALPKTNIKHVIVTEIGDLFGGLKGFITNFVVKHVKKMVPAYDLPNATTLKKALSTGAKANYTKPSISADDIALLQYTGGTTGVSKGATLLNKNIVANILQVSEWMGSELDEGKETVITALPLYHIFALSVNCLTMLRKGAHNVLIVNPRDMQAFVKELNKYPFSVFTAVNTLFNGLMNTPEFQQVNFDHLKVVVGGGMAVQTPVAEKWKKLTGRPIAEGYGLSETAPVLTCNPIDGTEQLGTIGIPVPNTEVKILDDDGNEVAQGEPGEICAKGPQVMQGYWNRDEETAKVFHGEWFRTGDIGIMEESGFFKIVDRKKDMILVSGFNVYPNEVEDVVAGHDKVLEVAAIGVPDPKSTEAVKIFVVKKDDSLTADEVKAYCKQNLTGYKVPKHIEFRADLPKSNVGKILRRKLKDADVQANA
ncbi:MAG: AMP-binding protein [Flammeovirgaceae bacterium]